MHAKKPSEMQAYWFPSGSSEYNVLFKAFLSELLTTFRKANVRDKDKGSLDLVMTGDNPVLIFSNVGTSTKEVPREKGGPGF